MKKENNLKDVETPVYEERRIRNDAIYAILCLEESRLKQSIVVSQLPTDAQR